MEPSKKRTWSVIEESEEEKRSRTRQKYGEMTLHYAKLVLEKYGPKVEVKSVGTQTDDTLSFDNARVDLMQGKVIGIDKKVRDVKPNIVRL